MANQTLILKGIVGALQIGLIILLITSGVHFKDVKKEKDAGDLLKQKLDISPDSVLGKYIHKVNVKYGALMALIILSTLKLPVIGAGLFLNHILILFGSFFLDMIVAILYLVQWGYFTKTYAAGSWLGILCSIACGVMTIILIRFIKREVR